jgi:hypothetical protein
MDEIASRSCKMADFDLSDECTLRFYCYQCRFVHARTRTPPVRRWLESLTSAAVLVSPPHPLQL